MNRVEHPNSERVLPGERHVFVQKPFQGLVSYPRPLFQGGATLTLGFGIDPFRGKE